MQVVGESATCWGEALNWDAGGAAVERPTGLGQATAFIRASLLPSVNKRQNYYFSLRATVWKYCVTLKWKQNLLMSLLINRWMSANSINRLVCLPQWNSASYSAGFIKLSVHFMHCQRVDTKPKWCINLVKRLKAKAFIMLWRFQTELQHLRCV